MTLPSALPTGAEVLGQMPRHGFGIVAWVWIMAATVLGLARALLLCWLGPIPTCVGTRIGGPKLIGERRILKERRNELLPHADL